MSELLQFSPHGTPPSPEFDLSDLVPEVCDALERESLRRRVSLETDIPPYTMLRADRDKVRLLLSRVLSTVLAIAPPGSDASVTGDSDEDGVEIEVALSGARMRSQLGGKTLPSPDEIRAAWSDVRRLVVELGGQLSVAEPGQSGIVCTLQFPRLADADAQAQKAAA
jgi:hypothetical protein